MAYKPMPGTPDPEAKKPNIRLPEEYEDDAQFLEEMREIYSDNESAEFDNHLAGAEDLAFFVGDQWDDTVKQKRIAARKPVLTINRLPAFVAQIMGSRKLNETVVKILPDNGGTIAIAKVREGLMRSIQQQSKADFAYDNALLGGVVCGVGNFQLVLEYETNDVWDVSIRIRPIADHFAVLWDRTMIESTGSDAGNSFVMQTMPLKEFYTRWPWATPSDVMERRFPAELYRSSWFTRNDVRVVDYWRMRTHERVLALMSDGSTQDITDEESTDKLSQIASRPDGSPFIRKVQKPFAQRYVCSGLDVLEGPYELPIDRIPVFRVPGWEIRIGDTVHRWGLIRHMKDPQRLHNYWRSAIAEKIMRSPKNTWTAADTAVAGREQAWRNANTSDDPLLIWNAESGNEPKRQDPIQVEDALIAQAEITTQDLKDVSNIHEANLGMPSNEVSGAAINARVRVSDTGTAIYQDNLSKAIEECGRVTNDLIPLVYDTPRIIKVIGEDSKELMTAINQTGNKDSDITVGKYSVTASTGPSTATKRQESAQAMMALATAMPQTLAVAPDLLVQAQDWPMADKLAERFRKTLPPGLLEPDEMSPAVQQAQQASSEKQSQADQLMQQDAAAKYMTSTSQSALNFARARNYETAADAVPIKVQNESVTTASEAANRELQGHLDTIKVATGGK